MTVNEYISELIGSNIEGHTKEIDVVAETYATDKEGLWITTKPTGDYKITINIIKDV
jgi:hypothetical protein